MPAGPVAELRLETKSIRPTADLIGILSVTNHEHPTVDLGFTGNPAEGWMMSLRAGRIVSVEGDIPIGTGAAARLAPGQTARGLKVVVGTARCGGPRGSELPPGRYEVITQITLGESNHTDYVKVPVEVTVQS